MGQVIPDLWEDELELKFWRIVLDGTESQYRTLYNTVKVNDLEWQGKGQNEVVSDLRYEWGCKWQDGEGSW